MKDRILRMNLSGYANKVRHHMKGVIESMTWLHSNLPMEETLQRNGKLVYDKKGEVFLYYDGIYYSWEIILSILKENEIVTIGKLYECNVN